MMSEESAEDQSAETKAGEWSEPEASDSEQSACTAILQLGGEGQAPAEAGGGDVKSMSEAKESVPADNQEDRRVILSAASLARPDGDENLIEIDLNQEPSQSRAAGSSSESSRQMFSPHSVQPANAMNINESPEVGRTTSKGFGHSRAKLCVVSERVREYLDSLRPISKSSGERARFYQFFKSTRTELVASLLYVLIGSQTLISCRANLTTATTANNRLAIHLIFGLISSVTVATLTQVFGHVSGCHLIPANSLALYVKGHISRFRLAAYLFAQLAGALLAISLLTLLTSSQFSPDEAHYNQVIQQFQVASVRSEGADVLAETGASTRPEAATQGWRRRRRRELARPEEEAALAAEEALPGASEATILLSIMEQREEELRRRRSWQVAAASEPAKLAGEQPPALEPAAQGGPERKTINQNGSRAAEGPFGSGSHQVGSPASASNKGHQQPLEQSSEQKQTSLREEPLYGTAPSWAPLSASRRPEAPDNRLVSLVVLETTTEPAPSPPPQRARLNETRNDRPAPEERRLRLKVGRLRRAGQQQPPPAEPLNGSAPKADLARPDNKQTLDHHFVNLLGLALPDGIMAGESLHQCSRLQNSSASVFEQCILLSNPSQMFVFQLLATLMVVLCQLVNLEPRRTDLGFKSLSIGLSYLVASVLTIHSGGFYANPFQVVFLAWLASSGQWQAEWFVYLVVPLVGGLLGAMSHEYIDFSSLRNRNKQLHLRRSFYSLDELPGNNARRSGSGADNNENHFQARLSSSSLLNGADQPGQARSSYCATSTESAGSGATLTGQHQPQPEQQCQMFGLEHRLNDWSHVPGNGLCQINAERFSAERQIRRPSNLQANERKPLGKGASSSSSYERQVAHQQQLILADHQASRADRKPSLDHWCHRKRPEEPPEQVPVQGLARPNCRAFERHCRLTRMSLEEQMW